jgi:hypothetical protein
MIDPKAVAKRSQSRAERKRARVRKLTLGAACVAAVLVIFSISQDWLDRLLLRQGAGSLRAVRQRKAAAAAGKLTHISPGMATLPTRTI